MNIAELFVNLGIKGSEKTVGALTGVKKSLGEVSSMSLEAKAAIVGAVYALERLMSNSAQTGTNLSNFTTLTGLSAKTLQQWQYAARQAGVSGEELTGSLKAVQNSMTNMLLGKGAPEGLGILANKVGFDSKRAKDTFYVMEQLQKFSKTVPPDIANSVMKSFGLSEGTIAAMRKNVFRPEVFKKAPTYSDKEVNQLSKVDVAWKNLGANIEMAMGHFTSKHGMQLVGDISKLTVEVFKLVDAFTKLAEKLKLFALLGKAFEGWSMIFSGASKGVDAVSGAIHDKKKRGELGEDIKQFFGDAGMVGKYMLKEAISPSPSYAPAASGKTQTINVNQNLNFQHDGKDHKKTSDSVKKAIQDSYRQMPAQTQGS